MKILYGITKSNFGGAQRYVFDMATAAKENGHDVTVVLGKEGVLSQKLSEAGVHVISIMDLDRDISPLYDARSFISLIEILKYEKPDVFHINSAKMGGLGALAARLVGIKKIIFTAHGLATHEKRPGWQKRVISFLIWCTVFLSHKTICVSERIYKDLSHLPLLKNKFVIIKNGIGELNFLSRIHARQALVPHSTEDTLIVAAISELHHIKGLDTLLHAWNNFHAEHNARLVIIGSGDEQLNLHMLRNYLGLSKSVTLTGFLPDAHRYLSGVDIFVLPSRSEGLPYALLEAGHAGKSVIASHVGGIPEVVTENSGITVPAEDVESLSNALRELAKDENKRTIHGENLRKTVQNEFSREKMVRDTLDLYA